MESREGTSGIRDAAECKGAAENLRRLVVEYEQRLPGLVLDARAAARRYVVVRDSEDVAERDQELKELFVDIMVAEQQVLACTIAIGQLPKIAALVEQGDNSRQSPKDLRGLEKGGLKEAAHKRIREVQDTTWVANRKPAQLVLWQQF